MQSNIYKNKSILVTGGTGSFGKKFVQFLLKQKLKPKKIIIYSRDELKQHEMNKKYNIEKFKNLRYFIGDVRDKERLNLACEDVDIIVHSAALKQVPATEYNPFECIQTNILGAQNVISSAINNKVKNIIALSTDKAASPINLYGAAKLCSDKLFTSAQNFIGKKKMKFSVVRYGNVMGSRGSVIPLFNEQKKNKLLRLTHKDMTRFNITLDEAIKMVDWSIKNSYGGEIFVPKIASYRLLDLAKSICEESRIVFTGIRPGEKIHELLITKDDSTRTVDLGKYYAILPTTKEYSIESYCKKKKCKLVKKNFEYSSNNNTKFLNINELRKLIKKYV